jgi:hypothetical protein
MGCKQILWIVTDEASRQSLEFDDEAESVDREWIAAKPRERLTQRSPEIEQEAATRPALC